ncbi:MAG: THUMP domain-containing protein, partial [Myxococcota bacterium]|nr:THUMP domain-containing protein [Myxococcota bacterium]
MSHRPTHRYVATTSLGLEGLLADELVALGASAVQPWAGGASFEGDRHMMMRACLWLRTAHRVRWILDECQVRNQDDLYPVARRVARWERLCPPDRTIAVRASLRNSPFRDERIVALKVKDAIVDTVRDAVGSRPDVSGKDPDVGIHVRLSGTRATFSLDAAGQSLHIRGYRTQSGPAPLRETLAAGALLMSGWDGTSPLVDPMCGSGTLLVEGALIATGRAPGLDREFGFQRWPSYRPKAWEAIRQEAVDAIHPAAHPVVGREVSARVLAYARDNGKRAGVGDAIRWEQGRM